VVTVVGGKVVFENGKLDTNVRGEALKFDAEIKLGG
jgi:dihydroorotase